MMRYTIIGLFMFFLVGTTFGQTPINNTSFNHPDNFITPKGQEVKFVVIGNNYYIQWKQSDTLKTFDYPFNLVEGGNSSFPRLVAENENYVVLRSSCGSPCWVGLFLPLYKGGRAKAVHEYIAFDINAKLVAYVSSSDSIAILNLRTFQKQYFHPGKCESAFLGYCIDTAYFENNSLHYKWATKTVIHSAVTNEKEYKIKNNWD